MKVLGILGSPRVGGNSDILLEQALSGAKSAGAEVEKIVLSKKKISGCLDCGTCNETGVCAVKDDMLEGCIEAIEKSASTGKIGDGKIFVFNLEQCIRIRTGESGDEAL